MKMSNQPSEGDNGDWSGLPGPVSVGCGRCEVRLTLRSQGRDLVLQVIGGEAHVGAVAVVPAADDPVRTAHAGGGRDLTGSEPGLYVVPGHKEGPLAAECAERLAAVAGCTCLAVVGIHQDQATRTEIEAIVENVRQGTASLLAALESRSD